MKKLSTYCVRQIRGYSSENLKKYHLIKIEVLFQTTFSMTIPIK